MYIPSDLELRKQMLDELHQVPYSMHPIYQKVVTTAQKSYFWLGMKKDVVDYIIQFQKCQQVKAKHQHLVGLLQRLPILEWKWETISMDFIMGLPMRTQQHESIMVVVDKLLNSAHFIQVKSTHKTSDIAQIFIKDILWLHSFPKATISNRDSKFTLNFWKSLFQDLGTQLNFNTVCHPQTDSQTERVSYVLKDMLQMYVMDRLAKWDDYLTLL